MQQSNKLTPCPFCKGRVVIEWEAPRDCGRIYCESCMATRAFPYGGEDAAIDSWNRGEGIWRPIASAPQDGTPILVYAKILAPERWGVQLSPFYCVASYHKDAGWCVDEIREAVYWQPLPPAPYA